MRYGFVDPEAGKSLTQLEYEETQAVRLPSLIYVNDEETHPVLPKHVETGASAEKLRTFKEVIKRSHAVNFFSSPEDLAAKVTQDLVRLIGSMGKEPTTQVLSQLAANAVKRHPLTQPRFAYLKQRTSRLSEHDVPDAILREALELVIGGDNMAAAFVLSRGTPTPLDDAIDWLIIVEKVLVEIRADNNRQVTAQMHNRLVSNVRLQLSASFISLRSDAFKAETFFCRKE